MTTADPPHTRRDGHYEQPHTTPSSGRIMTPSSGVVSRGHPAGLGMPPRRFRSCTIIYIIITVRCSSAEQIPRRTLMRIILYNASEYATSKRIPCVRRQNRDGLRSEPSPSKLPKRNNPHQYIGKLCHSRPD